MRSSTLLPSTLAAPEVEPMIISAVEAASNNGSPYTSATFSMRKVSLTAGPMIVKLLLCLAPMSPT